MCANIVLPTQLETLTMCNIYAWLNSSFDLSQLSVYLVAGCVTVREFLSLCLSLSLSLSLVAVVSFYVFIFVVVHCFDF